MLTLAEELVVLSYDPDKGDRVTAPPLFNACLIGAELVELAWRGRVSVTEDAVLSLDSSPLGNAGLDRVLRVICLSPPALPLYDYTRPWRSLLPDHRAVLRTSLLDRGVLVTRARRRWLGLRSRRYVAADPSLRPGIAHKVRACLLEGEKQTPREEFLAALTELCYFNYALHPVAELRSAKEAAWALQQRLGGGAEAASAVMRSLQRAREAHEQSE